MHNSALCLCLGEFRTSPASSMTIMVSEPPLQLRWQNTLQYCVKFASDPCSPVSSAHSLKSSLPRNQTRLLHLVFVPLRSFEILVLSERTLSLTVPITPPWLLARPVINFGLHCYDKSSTSP